MNTINFKIGEGSGSHYSTLRFKDNRGDISCGNMINITFKGFNLYLTIYPNAEKFDILKKLIESEKWNKVFSECDKILSVDQWKQIAMKAKEDGYNEGWNAHIDAVDELLNRKKY